MIALFLMFPGDRTERFAAGKPAVLTQPVAPSTAQSASAPLIALFTPKVALVRTAEAAGRVTFPVTPATEAVERTLLASPAVLAAG